MKTVVIVMCFVVSLVFVLSVFAQSPTDKLNQAATAAQQKAATAGSSLTEQGSKAAAEKTGAGGGPEKRTAPAKPAEKQKRVVVGPCKQIVETCKNAGFVYGEVYKGYGLYADCIDPIMQGKTKVPNAVKPLPTVDPKLIGECHAKDPYFGKGIVGYRE